MQIWSQIYLRNQNSTKAIISSEWLLHIAAGCRQNYSRFYKTETILVGSKSTFSSNVNSPAFCWMLCELIMSKKIWTLNWIISSFIQNSFFDWIVLQNFYLKSQEQITSK